MIKYGTDSRVVFEKGGLVVAGKMGRGGQGPGVKKFLQGSR